MTHQIATAPRRIKPRWVTFLILFAAIGMVGVVWNTHLGSQRPQADRRDFRKASRRAVEATSSRPTAPQSAGDIRQVSTTGQSALMATLAIAETELAPVDPHRSALQSALSLLENSRN